MTEPKRAKLTPHLTATTSQVPQFSTILGAICVNIAPGAKKGESSADSVCLSFAPDGMRVESKNVPDVLTFRSFWDLKQFGTYQCEKSVSRWVPKKRLLDFRKKINGALYVTLTAGDSIQGFKATIGQRAGKGEKDSEYSYMLICEDNPPLEPIDYPDPTHTLQLQNDLLCKDIGFISSDRAGIKIKVSPKGLKLLGILEGGQIVESILVAHCQTASDFDTEVTIARALFRVISALKELHGGVELGFYDMNMVHFKYLLSTEESRKDCAHVTVSMYAGK